MAYNGKKVDMQIKAAVLLLDTLREQHVIPAREVMALVRAAVRRPDLGGLLPGRCLVVSTSSM